MDLHNGKEILTVMITITMKVVIGMEVTVVEIMSRKTTALNVNVRIQILGEEMMEEIMEEIMEEMEVTPHNPVVNVQFIFNIRGSYQSFENISTCPR